MKKILWIILIFIIVVVVCCLLFLNNMFSNKKYDLKNISENHKQEIIISNEITIENEVDYDKLKQYFEEYSTIQIFLKNDVTSKQEENLLEKLKKLEYFKEIKFISSQESNEELRNRIGDIAGNLSDYGVPDKIKINCYYLDDISLLNEKEYFEKIESEIKKADTENIIDNITTAGIIEIYNKEGMEAVEEYIEKCEKLIK